MDYIKRTICLEGARTRTQGLMPYYEFGGDYGAHDTTSCHSVSELNLTRATGENGNWGQFVANPCFLAQKDKTYEAMLHNYYSLLNMVREGVKLRKVETKDGEVIFTEGLDGVEWIRNCSSGPSEAFNEVTEPDYLYDYAAYDANDFYASEIEVPGFGTKKVFKTSKSVSQPFVVLVGEYEKFKGLASYLDGTSYHDASSKNIGSNEHTKWADYCRVVDDCIGKINVPASIFNKHVKVPKSMPCADVQPYLDWLTNYPSLSADCCNTRLWEDMGGNDMLVFLRNHTGECRSRLNTLNGLDYAVPYIEIPLLLNQTFTDVGTLTNVDGVEYEADLTDKERPHGLGSPTGLTIDQIVMNGHRVSRPATWEYDGESDPAPIVVESLLKTLRSRKKYTDDEDNVLPGLFQSFDDPSGKFFKCEKSGDEWTMSECGEGSLVNGDGKTSAEVKNTTFYRSITIAEAGKRMAEVEENESGEEGGTYYFKAKYDNSESKHMTIPFKVGNTANVYLADEESHLYRGDYIQSIDTETFPGEILVTYIIGGYFYMDDEGGVTPYQGGDVYKEKHVIHKGHVDYVALDGVDNVPVYSDYIDFEDDSEEFYSPVYNLYRTGNTANIVEYETGEIWDQEFAYDAYLTKEDYLINFSLPPKVDVNVTIDRGGVSAFEKHYKLAECNTMQDLENYNNGEFFPEI